jgi:hypothetical protein
MHKQYNQLIAESVRILTIAEETEDPELAKKGWAKRKEAVKLAQENL